MGNNIFNTENYVYIQEYDKNVESFIISKVWLEKNAPHFSPEYIHNDNGPAIESYYIELSDYDQLRLDDGETKLFTDQEIERMPKDKKQSELWFKNGILHREYDLPAIIEYGKLGNIITRSWFMNGINERPDNIDGLKPFNIWTKYKKDKDEVHSRFDVIKYPLDVRQYPYISLEVPEYKCVDINNDVVISNIYNIGDGFYKKVTINSNDSSSRSLFDSITKRISTIVEYSLNGKGHDYNGSPSLVCNYEDGTHEDHYLQYGKYYYHDDHPSIIQYLSDGVIIKQWLVGDDKIRYNGPTMIEYKNDIVLKYSFSSDSNKDNIIKKWINDDDIVLHGEYLTMCDNDAILYKMKFF